MIDLILEVGSNHNCEIERAYKLIETAAFLGADYVKFQLFTAETLYAPECIKERKYAKKRELPIEWIPKLYTYAHSQGIKIGYSVFSKEAVESVKDYTDFLKVSSFDILRLDLIKECLKTDKTFMISLGLASREEMNIIDKHTCEKLNRRIVFFHCIPKYPTDPSECNLSLIKYYKENYPDEIGWSDHTREEGVILEAIRQGATAIELHFDLVDQAGCETQYGHCWSPSRLHFLIRTLRTMKKATGEVIEPNEVFKEQRKLLAWPSDGLRHM